MTAAIDTGKLLELVWAAALAGIAVSVVFALIILGTTRADDRRRAGRDAAAGAYLVLAGAAGLVMTAGVVFGVSVVVTR